MTRLRYKFSNSSVDYYFEGGISHLNKLVDKKSTIVLTDENVFLNHSKRLKGWNVVVLKAGEEYKVQETVDSVIHQLIQMGADRKTILVGIGGGVITDLTGYIASVYMRGIGFGFIPTSVLGLVDASIGGKNGVDVGVYKNMVGVIRQPLFILHDIAFLTSLPEHEWVNGFAEIIKHAAIRDAAMFRELENNSLSNFRSRKKLLNDVIKRNAILKTRIVQNDEFEKGERRLLNFGHTLGHALENQYELSHGQAISIGMVYAARISSQLIGFRETARLVNLLDKYGLPTDMSFEKDDVLDVLRMDKKRERKEINYVLLDKIGKGIVKSIPLAQLEKIFDKI